MDNIKLRNKKNFKYNANLFTKLSVLMVSTYPPDRDGVASYTARLENALKKENINVRIAANGIEWKRNSLSYIPSIIRKALGSKPNIVHVQLTYFMFGNEYYTGLFPFLLAWLKLLGKKTIVTVHDIVRKTNENDVLKDYTSQRFLRYKCWALNYFTMIVCSIADRVVVHSEIARYTLSRDYAVHPDKIEVIPHGIDQVAFSFKENPAEKVDFTHKKPLIVTYFGLVRHGKGLEDLVKAWKRLKLDNAKLFIIGGKHPTLKDDCYEELIKLIKELELETSIRFYGYTPNNLLPIYLEQSDAFIFPYNEWGNVIASSGALSIVAPYMKPIIATDVPAFNEIKKHKCAIIVEKGDIDGLASAITRILTDTQTVNSLRPKLNEWVDQSSWSNVARTTVLLYNALMQSPTKFNPKIDIAPAVVNIKRCINQ